MLYRIQKKESRILFSSPNTCVQRFDRVLSAFIFIILAPDYSLKPPRFYGNEEIMCGNKEWTAKYGACPINPGEQVLLRPMVP